MVAMSYVSFPGLQARLVENLVDTHEVVGNVVPCELEGHVVTCELECHVVPSELGCHVNLSSKRNLSVQKITPTIKPTCPHNMLCVISSIQYLQSFDPNKSVKQQCLLLLLLFFFLTILLN